MKWNYFPLSDNNLKAKKQLFENLEMGACEHTLSKKLLSRFSNAGGPIFLIAYESLDLGAEWLYQYGSYGGGKSLREMPDYDSISWMDTPKWGLIPFVDKHLLKSKEAVVVCENWAASREDIAKFPEFPNESRLLFFKDEVYHVLTSDNAARPESIESAIRESEHHWAVGVCSLSAQVPDGTIPSEGFFDTIVANTMHIFTPALDGEGYLVWSPRTWT